MFSLGLTVSPLMRPVTAAVGSGSLTILAIAVAQEILWSDRIPPLPGPSEICPVLEGLVSPPWAFDLYSFALGICVHLGEAGVGEIGAAAAARC